MCVYECVEAEPGAPGVAEVVYVHAVVAAGLALAPQQQGVLGRLLLRRLILLVLGKTKVV